MMPSTCGITIAAARREAAGCGRQREEREPEPVHPALPELLAEAGGGDQQHGEGQPVAGDDPLERARARPQLCADRRERDVHDEEVEDDHERARQQHRQRRPFALGECMDPGHGGETGVGAAALHLLAR
jgi:hypothetical protein